MGKKGIKEIEFRQGEVSLDELLKTDADKCECGGRYSVVNAYKVCNKCGALDEK